MDIAGDNNIIRFRPVLDQSRAQETTLQNLFEFQVSCFSPKSYALVGVDGSLSPFFNDETFKRVGTNGEYASKSEIFYWLGEDKPLTFFAFAPSTADMKSSLKNYDGTFQLRNASIAIDGNANIDYKLTDFHIPQDISRQFDFITATHTYQKSKGAVDLNFRHRLTQVEIKVYGNNEKFNIEIAGVCIGNPEISGIFDFPASRWIRPDGDTRGPVSYIYQSREIVKALQRGIPVTSDNAFSIMGSAGTAMVIPTDNSKWPAKEDPSISDTPYSTDKMYFSVLLRLIDKNNNVIYPYPDKSLGMKVVYLAVDNDGKILSSPLYPGTGNKKFYTDKDLKKIYEVPANATVREYGWAAIPVDAHWEPGQRYVYNLDYSNGVGLHDPEDPLPGEPIVLGDVGITIELEPWISVEQPEIEVPPY